MSAPHAVAFGLLKSSRTFFDVAVEHVKGDRVGEYYLAVLPLATALELILKARLALEDPALLPRGSRVPTATDLDAGKFRTVSSDETIKRLANSEILKLTERQKRHHASLRNIRNRAVHYVDSTPSEDIRVAVGAGLQLWFSIHDSAFYGDEVYQAKAMTDVLAELIHFERFVAERMYELREFLDCSARPRTRYFDECSVCLQDAAVLTNNHIRCLFCRHSATIRDWAKLISDTRSVENCVKCECDSVIFRRWHSQELTRECICCGYFTGPEVNWCDLDGRPIPRLRNHGKELRSTPRQAEGVCS